MTLATLTGKPSQAPTSPFCYDVFVVHAAADAAFVQGYLIPALDLPPERVLVPTTFELGRSIVTEIERGVRSSRVTLVVLSPACLADDWAVFGEQIATYASIAQHDHGVLLPVLLADCAIPAHIGALVKLDFRSTMHREWETEVGRLRGYLERPAAATDLRCPYPGMRPFTERDAARFFGRDVEIDRIIRRIQRGEREIHVIGASGSGKSSLVAAGLIPRLTRGVAGLPRFQVQTFRPGERPLDLLNAALAIEHSDPMVATDAQPTCPTLATPLLIVIDQLEELFAIAREDQRSGFLAAIRKLRADPHYVLVFTLRADFYGAFLNSPLWIDCHGAVTRIDLGPLQDDAVRIAIEQPAREMGVFFQPELVSRLLDDAAREPGALPLLQETLFQLWGRRRQRLLALADYHSMANGNQTGLAFAVREHADAVVDALTDAQKAIALRIFLRLVSFGEGRADTRRQQPKNALRSASESPAELDPVLQHLVAHRLVTVTGDDQRGDIRVDLAHEVLIQAWSAFRDEIQAWRAHEQRRRELEASAAAWRSRGSGGGGLLDAVELVGALEWRRKAAPHVGHSSDLAAFLAASEVAQSRTRRRRRGMLVAVSLLAAVTSFLALVAWVKVDEAEVQRREAMAARSIAEERLEKEVKSDQARQAADQARQAAERAARDAEQATWVARHAAEVVAAEKATAIQNTRLAEQALRRAEANGRAAEKAASEAVAAREIASRAKDEVRRLYEKEHDRADRLTKVFGSTPIENLKK